MSGSAVSKRYASALFDIANESSQLNQVEEELKVVKEVFQNEKALNDVLNHPKVPGAKKKSSSKTLLDLYHSPCFIRFFF